MSSAKAAARYFSSSVASVEPLDEGQQERIQALRRKGFSEWAARAEVLAKDHPPGCDCAVCL